MESQHEKELTIIQHLEELRKRLMFCIFGYVICFLGCFAFVDLIRGIFILPAGHLELIYTTPPEALMANIRLASLAGLFTAMPIFVYQFLAFIFPALYKNEKRVIVPFVFLILIFFSLGVFFAYFIVLPFAISFFLNFASDELRPLFTITHYISFISNFLLTFGLVFQTPLVFLILGKLNIVTPLFLRTYRKYAVLIIFILGAIITPPDVFSQIMIAIPLILLYELGILLVAITQRKKNKDPKAM